MAKVAMMTVTPDMAEEWLDKYNTHNVEFNKRRAKRHVGTMERGEWGQDTQCIAFSGYLYGRGKNKPVLLNGQHRLAAVRDSGLAQEFAVMEGLEVADQLNMDTNAPRKFAQQLKLHGEVDVNNLAAITKLAFMGEKGTMRGQWQTPTFAELMGFFVKHAEDLREATKESAKPYGKLGGRRSAFGYLYYVLGRLDDPQVADDRAYFFSRLVSGEGLSVGDPIYMLREQYLAAKRPAHRAAGRSSTIYQIAVLTKAWNVYRVGGYVSTTIIWRAGGSRPEPFPDPK